MRARQRRVASVLLAPSLHPRSCPIVHTLPAQTDDLKESENGAYVALYVDERRFDSFRRVFNEERPHQAIDLETPADVYKPSLRTLPSRTEQISYPPHFEVRKISQDTTIRWKNRKVFVSNLLKREVIGLEEVGEGLWSVYFGPVHLGWLDERDYRIMDVKDKRRRR